MEDLSARVPVDLSEAEKTHGLFTENSVVVAEGMLQSDGVFKVAAFGLPPAETRAESQKALQVVKRACPDRLVILTMPYVDNSHV